MSKEFNAMLAKAVSIEREIKALESCSSFGTVWDQASIESRLAELREKQAALCAKLPMSYVHDVLRDSRALIVYRGRAARPDPDHA